MVDEYRLLRAAVERMARVKIEFAEELAELAKLPDSEIDTSDIPEVTDWSGARRGRWSR